MRCQVEALPAAELRAAHVRVSFDGQLGMDAGGLSRSFFSQAGCAFPALRTRAFDAADAASPRLWRLTPSEALVPLSAEALTGRVADAVAWTDDDASVSAVPLESRWDSGVAVASPPLEEQVLARYRACGRLAALALASKHVLGLPFAGYFIARVVNMSGGETLEELQAELRAEEGGAHSQA